MHGHLMAVIGEIRGGMSYNSLKIGAINPDIIEARRKAMTNL